MDISSLPQRMSQSHGPHVVVIIPCHDEEAAIGKVVAEFSAALPHAEIHVFDNNSSDRTVEVASRAGARVHHVARQGKGNVVRRGFADLDADIYVLVDGDDTYDAFAAPGLIKRLLDGRLDMVVGARVAGDQEAYRSGHRVGNRLLTGFAGMLFDSGFDDLLSGYRVFSRRYVKSFAAHSAGFEIETELALHALQLRMPSAELPTHYGARPQGSYSKLNTWRDGRRILMTMLRLFKEERPLAFFGLGFSGSMLVSLVLAWPVFETYAATGLVPRFPTAVLCATLALLGFLLLACGLILDTVTRGRIEAKHLRYLSIPAVPQMDAEDGE